MHSAFPPIMGVDKPPEVLINNKQTPTLLQFKNKIIIFATI